jgi:hypothetical protein
MKEVESPDYLNSDSIQNSNVIEQQEINYIRHPKFFSSNSNRNGKETLVSVFSSADRRLVINGC